MQRAMGTILDMAGRPVEGCALTVLNALGLSTPTLWSDDGVTALGSNVVTTNARGFYSFYARNGIYALQPDKVGYTAVDADLDHVVLYDPVDIGHPAIGGGLARLLECDFHSLFKVGLVGLTGGAVLELPTGGAGQITLKTPTSTFRNGWLDCVSDGTAQPNTPFIAFEESGAPATRSWGYVPTAPEQLIIETSLVLVGSHASAIRRFGLADTGLQVAADPANGIYVAQLHTNALSLVTRNSSTQTLTPFLPSGVTLTETTPVQLRFMITSNLVQVVATSGGVQQIATVTTNIPSTSVLLYLLGGSTQATAGVGFAVDYVRALVTR